MNVEFVGNDPIEIDLVEALGVDHTKVESGTLVAQTYGAGVVVRFTVIQFMKREDFQPYLDRLVAREAEVEK